MPANLFLLTLFAASSKPIRYFPNHNPDISTEPSVGGSNSRLAVFLNTLK